MTNEQVFSVGDAVTVLAAIWLPKEVPMGEGVIERVTYQSSDGTPLYWVKGFAAARTARTLRAKVRETLRCGGSGKELR